jgi:hypothetical protein
LFHTRLPRPPTDGRTERKKAKKKEGRKKEETHECCICWRPQEVPGSWHSGYCARFIISFQQSNCVLSAGRFENNNKTKRIGSFVNSSKNLATAGSRAAEAADSFTWLASV